MSKVTFLWDGISTSTVGTSRDYQLNSTNGYFNTITTNETWTGINLSYNVNTTNSPYPTSGTIYSYTFKSLNSQYYMGFEGASYTLKLNEGYEQLIQGLLSSADEWFGDSTNNFFYMMVGTVNGSVKYHGGLGVDTLDCLTFNKSIFNLTNTTLSDGSRLFSNFLGKNSIALDSVERIKFNDTSLALDIIGNTGEALKIIGAILGKFSISNKQILGIALNLVDGGNSYLNILDLALSYKLGPNYSNQQEINLLYSNVFNSTPSAITNEMFLYLLNKGILSHAEFALAAAETTENATNINLTGLAQTGIEYTPA